MVSCNAFYFFKPKRYTFKFESQIYSNLNVFNTFSGRVRLFNQNQYSSLMAILNCKYPRGIKPGAPPCLSFSLICTGAC